MISENMILAKFKKNVNPRIFRIAKSDTKAVDTIRQSNLEANIMDCNNLWFTSLAIIIM